MSDSQPRPEWVGAKFDYEGRVLMLRVRPAAETVERVKQFPHLATLTHQLEHVRADGMPESDSDESLAELDAAVHEALESAGDGLVMIVETFGGKRNYYACVAESQVAENHFAESWAEQVSRHFSDCRVSADIDRDQAWPFYRQYRREYKW